MTLLILTRHGASQWHREDRYAGRSDIPLAPLGRRQVDALAGWARQADLDAIVTSPMLRCRQTAHPVEEACGITSAVDDDLRELDFGTAEGLTKAELRARFPQEFAAFESDPVAHHLPGGERPEEAVLRLRNAVGAVERRHPDGRILVVGHSTASRLLLCDLLGVPLERYRSVFPYLTNCGLTRVRLRDGQAALLTFNEEPRMPDDR